MPTYELFHLAAVVELEKGAEAPHEREDVQPAVVLPAERDRLLVVAHRNETLEEVARLLDDERFEHVHAEREVLDGEAQQLREGAVEEGGDDFALGQRPMIQPTLQRTASV